MKKNFLLLFCIISSLVFSQEYTFYYELDYHKANGIKKLGIMRVGFQGTDPVLQLYKPNQRLFAVIRDFSTKERHYFYYINSKKKGEIYNYIGTVSNMKDLDDFFIVKPISDEKYPTIDKIILLHSEFGHNNSYYLFKNEVINKDSLSVFSLKGEFDNFKELQLFPIIKKEVKIILPQKLKYISFSKIQNLTSCSITTSYKNFNKVDHYNQGQVIKNTCD